MAAVDQTDAGRRPLQVVDQPECRHDRGGVDVATPALVVQAHVATDDGDRQGPAGLGHPVDGLRQLPHHFGMLRVAEVAAVDQRHRAGADAGHVEGRLGDHEGGAGLGSSAAPPAVAVGRQGQTSTSGRPSRNPRGCQAEQRGVSSGSDDGVEEQLVVVLPEHPRRVHEQRQQLGTAICRRGQAARVVRLPGEEIGRRRQGPVVHGCVVMEGRGRDVSQHFPIPAVEDPQLTRCR